MTKSIFFIAALLTVQSVAAQFTVNLLVGNNPPATLTDWANRREVFTLLINVTGGTITKPVKIRTDIKLADGTPVATTDLNTAPSYTFPPGNTQLTSVQGMPLEHMIFNGTYRTAMQRTGKLPAGTYQLCVRLFSVPDLIPVSEERCRIFNIASLQLPISVMPLEGTVLDANVAQTAITFRWTPLVPRPAAPVQYRLQVFEVLNGQTPMQAFRSNQPLLDRAVTGTTQYIWQPQISMRKALLGKVKELSHLPRRERAIALAEQIKSATPQALIIFRDDGTNGDKITAGDVGKRLIIFREDGTMGDNAAVVSDNAEWFVFRDEGTKGERRVAVSSGEPMIIFRDDGTNGDKIQTGDIGKSVTGFRDDGAMGDRKGSGSTSQNESGLGLRAVNNGDIAFVWTVQAIDASNGTPFSDGNINGDGRSEPIMFSVKRRGDANSIAPTTSSGRLFSAVKLQ